MARWEWDMGCESCGLCICIQADQYAKPVIVCEVCQRVLAVRAVRETPLNEQGRPIEEVVDE